MTNIASLHIRRTVSDDLPAVLALYRHLHQQDDPLDDQIGRQVWQRILSDPDHHLLIGELEGEPVASCVLLIIPNLTRGGRAYGLIENVVTHADYRGRGIGKAMMRQAMALAWRQGCYKVMLLTGRRDEPTLRFYESAGFLAGVKTGFIAYPPKS